MLPIVICASVALSESVHTEERAFPSNAFCSPQIAGNSHLQTVKQSCIIILYLGGTNLDIARFFFFKPHLWKTDKTIIIEFSTVKSIL